MPVSDMMVYGVVGPPLGVVRAVEVVSGSIDCVKYEVGEVVVVGVLVVGVVVVVVVGLVRDARANDRIAAAPNALRNPPNSIFVLAM